MLCVFWYPSPILHVHASFAHSPFRPIPSATLKVLSPWRSRMSSASAIHLLLTTAIPVYGNQERPPLPWVRLNFHTASSGSGSYCHSGGQPTVHCDSLLEGKASPAEMGLHLPLRKYWAATTPLERGKQSELWNGLLQLNLLKQQLHQAHETPGKGSFRSVKRSHKGTFPTPVCRCSRAAQPVGLDTWWLVEITLHLAFCLIRNSVLWVSFLYFLFWWHWELCVTLPSLNANLWCISWVNIHIKINPNLSICNIF